MRTTARGFYAHGINPETAAMDKGYDNGPLYAACAERDVLPVVPLRNTPAVKRRDHKPPCCEHGEWRFAGADKKRDATKVALPTGECKPASVWIKADRLHPLIPRETLRWKGLYRRRASVGERSADSRTNGRSHHCGCVVSSAYAFTPTSRSSRN